MASSPPIGWKWVERPFCLEMEAVAVDLIVLEPEEPAGADGIGHTQQLDADGVVQGLHVDVDEVVLGVRIGAGMFQHILEGPVGAGEFAPKAWPVGVADNFDPVHEKHIDVDEPEDAGGVAPEPEDDLDVDEPELEKQVGAGELEHAQNVDAGWFELHKHVFVDALDQEERFGVDAREVAEHADVAALEPEEDADVDALDLVEDDDANEKHVDADAQAFADHVAAVAIEPAYPEQPREPRLHLVDVVHASDHLVDHETDQFLHWAMEQHCCHCSCSFLKRESFPTLPLQFLALAVMCCWVVRQPADQQSSLECQRS